MDRITPEDVCRRIEGYLGRQAVGESFFGSVKAPSGTERANPPEPAATNFQSRSRKGDRLRKAPRTQTATL
jgi:hypothetical protein